MNRFWDHETKKFGEEPNYAGDLIDRLYSTPRGKLLNLVLYSRKYFNWYFGLYKNSHYSLPQVEKDIECHKIPMHEFIEQKYKCYSDFFLRLFKEGVRPFAPEKNTFPAFAEGNYFAFDSITPDIRFPVKGDFLNIQTILKKKEIAKDFEGGTIIICRLCPVDYHHFHYPDNGKTLLQYDIRGDYHSVNPLALLRKPDIFCKNYRRVNLLETENFGKIAYVEIGAMVVGKIVQAHQFQEFKKGDLKGHFEYGASTVIVIAQKGKLKLDETILFNSLQGIESKVKLGKPLAYLNPNF